MAVRRPPQRRHGARCEAAGVVAPGVNVSARDLPGFDADPAGRRPWYLEDEAEPRVLDAGPELMFALAKRNDVVLPYRDLGVRGGLPR